MIRHLLVVAIIAAIAGSVMAAAFSFGGIIVAAVLTLPAVLLVALAMEWLLPRRL